MARSPRQPKGPPLDSKWLKDQRSARAFLEQHRSEAEIEDLIAAGKLGVNLAELFGYFYPYRKWITGKQGALSPPSPKVPEDIFSYSDHKEELTYSELLAGWVNPGAVRIAEGHQALLEKSPLAPLSAIAAEALQFLETYSTLRLHADRLRRALKSDPRMMKRLATMRLPRQMFCVCTLIYAKKKKLSEPTSGELAALALQMGHEEFFRDMVTSPDDAMARLRAWDELKREARVGLGPFLEKILATPLDDPENAT